MEVAMGKLFVIDGVDSSGKETHAKLICEKLESIGYKVVKLNFPDYSSESSALVKMYLNGDFGKDPLDVNAYAAASFFAVDRYASFKTKWEKAYLEDETIIISDRYTTSNMVHQASKIDEVYLKDKFLNWLYELEFGIYGLPIPNGVFFLNMPPKFAMELMEKRLNKFNQSDQKDIHENNSSHIVSSYENAFYVAKKYSWDVVNCTENNSLKSIEEINKDLFDKIIKKMSVK
jgi:dTMP kinase